MSEELDTDSIVQRTSNGRLSKQALGEGYLVSIVVVLNTILVVTLIGDGSIQLPWVFLWLGPGAGLIGAVYWIRKAEFEDQQIWEIAKWGAFGIGVGTVFLFGLALSGKALVISGADTFRYGATVSTLALIGVFAGTTRGVYMTNRDLDLRNGVLRRVLRHDLRNDMTVVLCQLDEIESAVDDERAQKVRETKQKIETVVDLTDKVRRIDVSTRDTDGITALDFASLLRRRIEIVESMYPDAEIESDLPDTVGAWVDPDFGMVIDSVVESARSGPDGRAHLLFDLSVHSDSIRLSVLDRNQTIPEADLTAVASGSETALEHARGVELWLVRWLVEASEGDLSIDTENHHIEITLNRASDGSSVGTRFQSHVPFL